MKVLRIIFILIALSLTSCATTISSVWIGSELSEERSYIAAFSSGHELQFRMKNLLTSEEFYIKISGAQELQVAPVLPGKYAVLFVLREDRPLFSNKVTKYKLVPPMHLRNIVDIKEGQVVFLGSYEIFPGGAFSDSQYDVDYNFLEAKNNFIESYPNASLFDFLGY